MSPSFHIASISWARGRYRFPSLDYLLGGPTLAHRPSPVSSLGYEYGIAAQAAADTASAYLKLFQGPILLVHTTSPNSLSSFDNTRNVSDDVRLYCLNSEYIGVRYCRYRRYSQKFGRILPEFAIFWGYALRIYYCHYMGSTLFGRYSSILILRVLAALKVYTRYSQYSSILQVWRILRWASDAFPAGYTRHCEY